MKALRPTTDWYARVPKEPAANLAFRRTLIERASGDTAFSRELWIACSRDLLFYINTFGWLLEPRDRASWQHNTPFGNAREIPFITREYQDESLLTMQQWIGKKDMLATKSQEMGFSWMGLYLLDWSWRFENHVHYGLVSRDEKTMDSPGDHGSLMVKLDFIDEHLPRFLQPKGDSRKWRERNQTKHVLRNLANGSTITGSACTGEMFSGDRKRAIFCDEVHKWPPGDDVAAMASIQHVTNCRLFCSTFNGQRGQAGVFYDMTQDKEADMVRIDLHWTLDEDKAAGLYQWDGQKIVLLDKTYSFPTTYPFVKDGKKRSPYYDYECSRLGSTPQAIAAELDMDAGGATNRLFDPTTIAYARGDTRQEDFRCRLEQIRGAWRPKLIEEEDGPIQIWVPAGMEYSIDTDGTVYLPRSRAFSTGVDISYGLGGKGSSYSAIVVIDKITGEQIAEFRHIKMKPEPFAEFCYFFGTAFNQSLLCPEHNGPGVIFTGKLIELNYPNLWLRPKKAGSLDQSEGDKPGYHNSDGGLSALTELESAINQRKLIIHSDRIIAECERYFIDEQGKLKHPLVGKGRVNAPEKSHGDSAIACAMAWWAMHTDPEIVAEETEPEIPYGSFAWRRQEYDQSVKKNPGYWDPLEERSTVNSLSLYG